MKCVKRRMSAPRRVVIAVLCAHGAALYAQPSGEGGAAFRDAAAVFQNPAACDPFELISLRLADVFGRFGPPVSVYASRGEYAWQDDVVLEYKGVDFYVYKDQVWQVGLVKALGIAEGDPQQAVRLVFQNAAPGAEGTLVVPFSQLPWPAELRVNLNKNGKVAALYLYRAQY